MKVEIRPSTVKGALLAPPSKSMAHRYLIAAALAEGESIVHGIEFSQDILATVDCLRALGVSVTALGDTVTVKGGGLPRPSAPLQCRESGSTLRFMLPLCLLSGEQAVLCGSSRLMERPLTVYEQLCREKGFAFTRSGDSVSVCGKLEAGHYTVDGSISSQFITGLIFALLKTAGESTLTLTGKAESRSYINMTLSALHEFGFSVCWQADNTIRIVGGRGTAKECTVEGDYSNAAFFEVLNYLGGEVELFGLKEDSLQGDRIYREYFAALASGTPTLSLADCPDLGPVLFALAAALNGGTFTETARLKIKESDRGTAMAEELAKFGVPLELYPDRIVVPKGCIQAPAALLCGHNDHRIVMSLAVLCTRFGGVIDGAEAVAKSMPAFFKKLSSLGIEVLNHETE